MPKFSGSKKTKPSLVSQKSHSASTDALHMESYLEGCKEDFDAGYKEIVYIALNTCFISDYPPPAWVKNAFSEAYYKWTYGEVKTFDEALQIKPRNLKVVRKNMFAGMIYLRIQQLHREGESIDDELFVKVADELNELQIRANRSDRFAKTKVKDLYAAHRDAIATARKRRAKANEARARSPR
jgi:hypothetical protein